MNDPNNPLLSSSAANPLDALKTEKEPTRKGIVARLPKVVRDRINQMMRDGLIYREIIAELGADAQEVTEDHLSSWKSGGYAQWLKGMERREDLLFVQEAIIDRALKTGQPDLSKAAIQMAVTKAFQLLENVTPEMAQKNMDSNNFTRLLNSLAKLAEGEIRCDRQELESADREAKRERENQAPKQAGLSDEVRQEIEEHRFNPPA